MYQGYEYSTKSGSSICVDDCLIPQDKAAEFFGFYNFIGKSSVFLGPFMVSGIALLTGSPSIGILSLLILFIPGLILLWKVPDN